MADEREAAVRCRPSMAMVSRGIDEGHGFFETMLLTQVEGFTVSSRVRTTTEEIDLEIVNTSEAAFWKRSRDVVLVECKNLVGPVGKEAVVSLRDKVRHRRGRSDVGVLVSWNGLPRRSRSMSCVVHPAT